MKALPGYVPPMDVSLEYVIQLAIRQWGLSRREFDALTEDEQEDIIALYEAEQLVAAWQNRRDKLQLLASRG